MNTNAEATPSRPEFPIDGMKAMPIGMPLMLEAWAGLVSFVSSQPEALDAFKAATGMDLRALSGRMSIDKLVDQATGFERELIAAFADWVTSTLWGVEGQELPPDELDAFVRGKPIEREN